MERMFIRRRMLFVCFLAVAPLLVCVPPALGQPKAKLRPLRIALPSNTIAATHFYVGRSLGIFESHGFEPQILVLEPRAALAALLTGDLDFYTATGTTTRAALRGVPVRVIMVGLNRPDHVSGCIQGNHQHRTTARQSPRRLHGAGDREHNSYRTFAQAGTQTG